MRQRLRSIALLPFLIPTALPVMGEESGATILSSQVICKQPGRYIGWPTITQTNTGDLLVAFSGDREAHVCPWGKTQMVRSQDNGVTWSEPFTINNTPLHDRDAGILQTKNGTLLVSWFTSLAFDHPTQLKVHYKGKSPPHWQGHVGKLSPETRKKWLGNWVRRSTDGGKTWGKVIDSIVTAPHGPIELKDGRLMYLGVNHRKGWLDNPPPPKEKFLAAVESRDDGKTWQICGYIPVPEKANVGRTGLQEPHIVETADGKLIGMFRYASGDGNLWQTESADGGKTWSGAHRTAIAGFPPHLLRLKNGWLLVSYGRRAPPFSERACISRDGGKTWDVEHEITLRDAPNGDLGYPSSVQLEDGSILTAYYQIDKPDKTTSLMTTHWRLDE